MNDDRITPDTSYILINNSMDANPIISSVYQPIVTHRATKEIQKFNQKACSLKRTFLIPSTINHNQFRGNQFEQMTLAKYKS
jgi:hypothetical protein